MPLTHLHKPERLQFEWDLDVYQAQEPCWLPVSSKIKLLDR